MKNLDYYFETPLTNPDAGFLTLKAVTDRLAAGEMVELRHVSNNVVKETFQFRANRSTKNTPGIYVHGIPARNIEQVLEYLSNDAHSISKVAWFDGARFTDFVSDPNGFTTK